MFARFLLSMLAVLSFQTTAFAFDGFRTILDCRYETPSETFSSDIKMGLNSQTQLMDLINIYPLAEGMEQMDARSRRLEGDLFATVYQLNKAGEVIRTDQHQINVQTGSINSWNIAPGSTKARGDCAVKIVPPENNEQCAFFGAQTDFVRGGLFCANQQLPDHKDISYGAGNLWTDGAWCSSLKDPAPAQISFHYAGYDIFGTAPKAARLMFVNGYDKSDTAFKNNARAKIINVKSGNYFFETYELHDTANLQYLDLGFEIAMSDIVVEVVETYPGAKYDDLCISTISADFEYDPDYPYPGELYAKRTSGN